MHDEVDISGHVKRLGHVQSWNSSRPACGAADVSAARRAPGRIAGLPVSKLSTHTTSVPCSSRRWQTLRPRKPAPPVTTARRNFTSMLAPLSWLPRRPVESAPGCGGTAEAPSSGHHVGDLAPGARPRAPLPASPELASHGSVVRIPARAATRAKSLQTARSHKSLPRTAAWKIR